MDEGDLDFSNPEVYAGPNSVEDLPSSCSMDSFFDKIFEDTQHHACTHTHTCNPPGPDLSHTHTCFHAHTKTLPASADESAESIEKSSTKKRPCGNREAVRKYRDKKKAHAASLEEEVARLRAINQQLMKRLHNEAALEVEVARLRCLLVDLRGRIEGEIGSFPYQRPTKAGGDMDSNVTKSNVMGSGHVFNSCGFRCDDQANCFLPGMQGKNLGENYSFTDQVFGGCGVSNIPCMESGNESVLPVDGFSRTRKIEGSELSRHKHFDVSDMQNHT